MLAHGCGFYWNELNSLAIKEYVECIVCFPESQVTPGGGGGTQIWFRRGCAAEAAKPVPIFKGHFGGKGYPLLGGT